MQLVCCTSRLDRCGGRLRQAACLSLLLTLIPPVAFSQYGAVPVRDPATPDEIVVTARKTEEPVQEIPMSVQVLTGDLLDELDRTSLFDLQFSIPGLVVNNLGLNGAGFSLRGIADQGGSGAPVAAHWNGIYLGSSKLPMARMFDLDRIEVLKGPQGTLYGQNSSGGSINFHTRSPEREIGGAIEAARGSFDTTRVQGHVNFPVGSGAFRLAYVGSDGDGYIRNSIDDRRFAENDFWGLRASLSYDFTDRLRVDVVAQHVYDDGASNELWLPRPDFLADPRDIRLATVTLANPFLTAATDIVSATLEYDLGFAQLRSITGYANSTLRDVDDCAGGLPILVGCVRSALPSEHDQLSQELQLAARGDAAIDWLVGLYAYDDESRSNFYQLTPVISPDPTHDRTSESQEARYAVFGQATWRLSERWGVTGGLRLGRDEYSLATIGTGSDDSPVLTSDDDNWRNTSWRLDLEYAATETMLVFGGASTGFRSGGLSIGPGGVLDAFDPEKLFAYEAGIKSQWLDRRLTLNGSAFFYDFRDMQVSTSTITDDGLIFEIDNAAKARIYGADAEAVIRLSDRFTVSTGMVWLPKREFVEYRNDRTGDTLSGNDLARSPALTVTAALGYTQALNALGELSARVEYNYRSDFFYTTDNNPLFAQKGFGLTNAILELNLPGDKWYVFAAARNLGNVNYFVQVFLQASPGYPDTYELGFGYRY